MQYWGEILAMKPKNGFYLNSVGAIWVTNMILKKKKYFFFQIL